MKKLILGLLLFAAPVFAQTPATKTVTLTWQEATPGVTFNIYRWDKSQLAGFTKINAVPVTALTYNDTTAVMGVAYSYKVSAVNSAGESAQSVEADITITGPIALPPGVPTNLKVTVIVTN